MDINHGVPQGSILGPFLFIVTINDLYYKVSGSVLFYADDTTLFSSHSDFGTAMSSVQNRLELSTNWFSSNKLVVNESKTHYCSAFVQTLMEMSQSSSY